MSCPHTVGGLPAHLVQDASAPNLAALGVDGAQLSHDVLGGGSRRGKLAHAPDWVSSQLLSLLGSSLSFLGSSLGLLGSSLGFLCSSLLLSLESMSI